MPTLISQIVCEPAEAFVGQEVHVSVLDGAGNPYTADSAVTITINGVTAPSRWIRFRSAGNRRILVAAEGRSGIEHHTASIPVEALPAGDRPLPSLHVSHVPEAPFTLSFAVVEAGHPFGALALAGGRLPARPLARTPRRRTLPAAVSIEALGTVGHAPQISKLTRGQAGRGMSMSRTGGQAEPVTFEWDFGDGSPPVGTATGTMGHDFSQGLDGRRRRHFFTVAVKLVQAGKTVDVLHQTVTMVDPYALARSRGVLLLPSPTPMSVELTELGGWRGEVLFANFETESVLLTKRRVEAFFADDRRTVLGPVGDVHVSVPAGGGSVLVHVDARELPADAVSFAVHLGGEHGRMRVRTSAYFDIPARRRFLARQLDPALGSLIRRAIDEDLVKDPKHIRPTEIAALISHKLLPAPRVRDMARVPGVIAAAIGLGRTDPESTPMKPLQGHMEPPPAIEGAVCDPHNLPDNIEEGLVCQPGPDWDTVHMPGRFMNAKKGDIILSPMAPGLIGGILETVGQFYSHCGIMTRNHDEITHSTASEERLLDYPDGVWFDSDTPFDGFQPDKLRYLWPGSITQRVEDAVEGESFIDPINGESYHLTTFNPDVSILESGQIIPALVVKPDVFLETTDIRQTLSDIADVAIGHAGKSHYRFYSYTDPNIYLPQLEKLAPADYDWSPGSWPSTCSAYVWRCVREIFPFPEKGVSTPGLHLYSEAKRKLAGEFIYDFVYTLAEKQASAAGVLELIADIEDTADDIGNQVCNAFASDFTDTEAKDSEDWKTPGASFSISPDDIRSWDPPEDLENPGIYGHDEPLIYRAPRDEFLPIFTWKRVETRGSIAGIVTFNGKPAAGVRVEAFELMFDVTDENGRFELLDVPTGTYVLQAYKTLKKSGQFLNAPPTETLVEAGETTNVVIELRPPDPAFREVIVNGFMYGVDDEFAVAGANPSDWRDCDQTFHLGPNDPHKFDQWDLVVDDSVKMRCIIAVDLHPDNSVQATLTAKIFENEKGQSDVEGEQTVTWTVPPDTARSWEGLTVVNDDDDYCIVDFTVTNNIDVS